MTVSRVVCTLAALVAVTPGLAQALAASVRSIALPAKDILYDPGSKKLYVSVPGSAPSAGSRANSITAIDPATGEIGASTFVGSEPGRLALSLSGRYLYVALEGAGAVRQFDMSTGKAGVQFPVGPQLGVSDLAAISGCPDGIVVARRGPGSPCDAGAAVYDNGVERKNTVNAGESLTYEPLSARTYGYENCISTWGLRTLVADKSGAVELGYREGLMQGNCRIVGCNGLLYNDVGDAYDPVGWYKAGHFPNTDVFALPAVDPAVGRAYFVIGFGNGLQVLAYDTRTYARVGELSIPGARGPGRIVRFGADGLAFIAEGAVYLVHTALIPTARPPVDLALVQSALPAASRPGAELSYTLTVANASQAPATGVCVSDRLSPNADVLSVAAAPGSATAVDGAVRADIGDLAPGANATVTVKLRIKQPDSADAKALAPVTHFAVARADQADAKPANNAVSAAVSLSGPGGAPLPVQGVDLTGSWKSLAQSSTGAGADLQSIVSGVFVVRNVGTKPASPTRLRLFLSDERILDPLAALLQETGVPALAPGASYAVTIKARLQKGDDAIGLYVIAVVNATKSIAEVNTRNNVVPGGPIP